MRALCNNRFLRKHPWAEQGRPCVPWDLFPAGCDPVRGSSRLDWGDSLSPPCPCTVPPADHREGGMALGGIVRQRKAGGFSRDSCEDFGWWREKEPFSALWVKWWGNEENSPDVQRCCLSE